MRTSHMVAVGGGCKQRMRVGNRTHVAVGYGKEEGGNAAHQSNHVNYANVGASANEGTQAAGQTIRERCCHAARSAVAGQWEMSRVPALPAIRQRVPCPRGGVAAAPTAGASAARASACNARAAARCARARAASRANCPAVCVCNACLRKTVMRGGAEGEIDEQPSHYRHLQNHSRLGANVRVCPAGMPW